MIEKGMYYAVDNFYSIIKELGGTWSDTKRRPLLCLIESQEQNGLYWAIPMGMLNHRDDNALNRVYKFLSMPDNDLRSCYYHIGRTTNKSIFFISDVIPIIDKYIDSPHLGADNNIFILKNKLLILELERKLNRILAFENTKNNYFRQHITDIKKHLINKLQENEK